MCGGVGRGRSCNVMRLVVGERRGAVFVLSSVRWKKQYLQYCTKSAGGAHSAGGSPDEGGSRSGGLGGSVGVKCELTDDLQ